MSQVAVSVLEHNQENGRAAVRIPRVRQEPTVFASLELSRKVAELYALEEEDFRVFRDLCDAFNSLGKRHLGGPFEAGTLRWVGEGQDAHREPDDDGLDA